VRIATWNVNSLKARLDKVTWWLERARPDVLLLQETKLADGEAPVSVFRSAGYELAHHGEGRWNGVAIASRGGVEGIVTNFGEPLRPAQTPDVGDDEPLAEARMISAVCGGIRVVCVYAPNGRTVGSPFYEAKLAWFDRLARWLAEGADPAEPVVLGGDLNVAPADIDVWAVLALGQTRPPSRGRSVSVPSRLMANSRPDRLIEADLHRWESALGPARVPMGRGSDVVRQRPRPIPPRIAREEPRLTGRPGPAMVQSTRRRRPRRRLIPPE